LLPRRPDHGTRTRRMWATSPESRSLALLEREARRANRAGKPRRSRFHPAACRRPPGATSTLATERAAGASPWPSATVASPSDRLFECHEHARPTTVDGVPSSRSLAQRLTSFHSSGAARFVVPPRRSTMGTCRRVRRAFTRGCD
jgi:hypothetical protein